VDPVEAMSMGLGDGQHAILLLGFESSKSKNIEKMEEALEYCKVCISFGNYIAIDL
jgi:hypothetical protein